MNRDTSSVRDGPGAAVAPGDLDAAPRRGTAALELHEIAYGYFGRNVLDGVSLSVAANEITALVGPSGCGKSTLAHIAAGVIEPLRGSLRRGYRRHGMVFQALHLLPWATARGNIDFPLRLLRVPRSARRERVEAAADRVALRRSDLEKYPAELSGGMRQRAAIARALVIEPDFIYFDEPFTALDVALRRRMQDLVIDAARAMHFAGLFITHDLLEAFRIAHRVAVMDSNGQGIVGERRVPGRPGERDEVELFGEVARCLKEDPLFRGIHDVDESKVA